MPYYSTCLKCGANLDPGERCDCQKQDAPPAPPDEASENKKESSPKHSCLVYHNGRRSDNKKI